MPIIVNLDVVMAQRKISATQLAEEVGITLANLSILKNNKANVEKAGIGSHRGPKILQFIPYIKRAFSAKICLKKENPWFFTLFSTALSAGQGCKKSDIKPYNSNFPTKIRKKGP